MGTEDEPKVVPEEMRQQLIKAALAGREWSFRAFQYDLACLYPCDGETSFIRAGGDCRCSKCGLEYRKHRWCSQSKAYSGEYVLNVLCDGTHVKL